MKPSKIEKYRLESRCLALFRQCRTTAEIADALTAELSAQQIDDAISQPTVSRWLKPYRDEVREETTQIIGDHIKAQVKDDLAVIDEVEGWHLAQFRSQQDPKLPEHLRVSLREASDMGMKIVKIIETKLRFALGGPADAPGSCSPVDLDAFRSEVEALRHGD